MDWLSLFVGTVIGFVIGALSPNKTAEKTPLLEKMASKLSLDESYHVSFSVSRCSMDDDDDNDNDVHPESSDPVQEFRLN